MSAFYLMKKRLQIQDEFLLGDPRSMTDYNIFAFGTFSFFLSFTVPPPHHLMFPKQPQLGNLLQVNRTLGRNVPLTSQLILMPNGAVAAVQQESPSTHAPGVQTDTDQVSDTLFWGFP